MATNGGSFLSSGPAKTLLGVLVLLVLLTGGAYALLYGVTHPPRERTQLDPADLLLRAEDVTFHATDDVLLSGWLVKGAPKAPVILLCHDLGGSRSSLLNSAVSLNRAGYALFVFDFRGHGLSTGSGGFLGVDEKRDILPCRRRAGEPQRHGKSARHAKAEGRSCGQPEETLRARYGGREGSGAQSESKGERPCSEDHGRWSNATVPCAATTE